jgi:predicted Fe-Mo cluster-binding NifX family protein
MKIAFTAQNRRTITGHAGSCRNFLIYDVEGNEVQGQQLIELPQEGSLHNLGHHEAHALDGIQILISGGMGDGLRRKLAQRGITALVTTEVDPIRALAAYLAGKLPQPDMAGEALESVHQHHHDHGQGHGKSEDHGCGGCGCSHR